MNLRALELCDAPAWRQARTKTSCTASRCPPRRCTTSSARSSGGARIGATTATAAVELAVAWAIEQLAVEEFVAVIDERNLGSRTVAERAGFTLDGLAEPWEHAESGTMLRYLFSSARS